MKIIKIIIISILVLITIYTSIKFINYYNIANDVILLENSSMKKYLKIYDLTENKPPKDVNTLKNYIKERDILLYDKIKNINLQYLKLENEDYGLLYLNGFDNKNDSLKMTYKLNDVDFFSSINVKGDIKLDFSYEFKKKANGVYKVSKDSIVRVGKVSVIDFYSRHLKCNGLKKKSLDYHPTYNIEVRIHDGVINYNSNELSKESINIIDRELKKSDFYLDKESVYLITLIVSEIKVYECFSK